MAAEISILSQFEFNESIVERIKRITPAKIAYAKREETPEALKSAEIFVGACAPADLRNAPRLKWVQFSYAGLGDAWRDAPEAIALTSAAGVYGIPIAEHVFAMMLALTRGLHHAIRCAPQATWKQPKESLELMDATCAVIGLGDIGRHVAHRAKAFGMKVLAIKRTPDRKPDYVDELHGLDGLDEVLRRSDHVVLCLPGTGHTQHLIDARRLSLMKPTAFIYNVGRGSVIDEAALIAALSEKKLAGAGLDVFEIEPLPETSPLWHLPNVVLTPHRSGHSNRFRGRMIELFLDNLQRFISQQPLRNLYNRQWGY